MNATYKNVIIQKIEEKESGSIIMPDKRNEDVAKGKIISVGPDCRELNIGDIVLYNEGEGRQVDNLLVISENNIICKIN